jgi:outer membrane protein assembly factor BamB
MRKSFHILQTAVAAAAFVLLAAGPSPAASFNFHASEQYIVSGDEVKFTATFDPEEDPPPEVLKIELGLGESGEADTTREYRNIGTEAVEPVFPVKFDRPGYFEATARFTLTLKDGVGNTFRDTRKVGPIDIYVANWKFTAGGTLGCIEASPVVEANGESIYFGSEDGNFYALDTRDGKEKWRFAAEGPINGAAALDEEGHIYFGSEDGHVYCLEPETGALVWQFPGAGKPATGHFYSSPALDEEGRSLYIGAADFTLYALDMDRGRLRWSHETGSKIISSPVIGHDHTVYAASLGGFLYAQEPDGSAKWIFKAANRTSASPALDADGTIYLGTSGFRGEVDENNGLHAISPSGKEKWFLPNINGFPAAPVIASSGTLCVGSYDNLLYGISRSGGRPAMFKTFEDDVTASPVIASNGYLFAGAKSGIFYALDVDEGDERSGRNEYWHYDLSMPITTSSPVVADGYVYVGGCGYESGALFSFLCDNHTADTGIGPAELSPWPQVRNGGRNTAKSVYTPETIAPTITSTDPEPGAKDLDISRKSISVTFSLPMEPASIYARKAETEDSEAFAGFTVEPFDAPDEDFTISWNEEKTQFTLTLPDGVSFEPGTEYTATILSRAHAEGDPDRSILYTYDWSFRREEEVGPSNSHDKWGCFISTLFTGP